MKKFQLFSCIFGIAILLSSCASQHHLELVGHYKPNTDLAKNQASAAVSHPTEMMKPLPSQNESELVAGMETTPDLKLLHPAVQSFAIHMGLTEKQEKKLDKKLEKVKVKLDKRVTQSGKQIQQNELSSNQQKQKFSNSDVNLILLVILSILLPPLAVYLYEDDITSLFWIDVILTIFFWIPGVIFALVVVLGGFD